MSLATEIQAQIAQLQAQLAVLNAAPSDTYNFGTVVVFSASIPLSKWYYAKTGEESWIKLGGGAQTRSLSEWILLAKQSNVGYFEVYVLVPQGSPIYASS